MRRPFLFLFISLLSGCQQALDQPGDLNRIKQKQELVVVTRNAPTTLYDWHDELTGPEYEMTQSFAKSLGVKVKYVIKDSIAEIIAALATGEADLAAAGLTRTAEREKRFAFGPDYQFVQQQVVCRRGGKTPRTIADLVDIHLVVTADTSYVEQLKQLQQQHPELQWNTEAEDDTEYLLEQVWLKKVDCTIADSNIMRINRRYYPELNVRFEVTNPQPVAWMLPPRADELLAEIRHWYDEFEQSGRQRSLFDRYYGFIDVFDFVDTRKYVRSIDTELPKYRKYFEQAAGKHGLDWTILAAQAYQESHWQANARSPTGVRGIMMLTLNTAKELGIEDRLNPAQSISGGARYLKKLYRRIPEEVPQKERKWFALAAYNVGMGHLWDARVLAARLDRNPNSWSDIKKILPLLSQKKYYRTLKHGYARGREPVRYVQRIRDYHNILLQRLNNH